MTPCDVHTLFDGSCWACWRDRALAAEAERDLQEGSRPRPTAPETCRECGASDREDCEPGCPRWWVFALLADARVVELTRTCASLEAQRETMEGRQR